MTEGRPFTSFAGYLKLEGEMEEGRTRNQSLSKWPDWSDENAASCEGPISAEKALREGGVMQR